MLTFYGVLSALGSVPVWAYKSDGLRWVDGKVHILPSHHSAVSRRVSCTTRHGLLYLHRCCRHSSFCSRR